MILQHKFCSSRHMSLFYTRKTFCKRKSPELLRGKRKLHTFAPELTPAESREIHSVQLRLAARLRNRVTKFHLKQVSHNVQTIQHVSHALFHPSCYFTTITAWLFLVLHTSCFFETLISCVNCFSYILFLRNSYFLRQLFFIHLVSSMLVSYNIYMNRLLYENENSIILCKQSVSSIWRECKIRS